MIKTVLIFGYNEFSMQIASHIRGDYGSIHLFALTQESCDQARAKGFEASLFDLGDEWTEIERYDPSEVMVFCALDDDAQNVFLTISLRASFESIYIIALAKNQESANKLKIAGANKVMPILQTTANIICDILEKPVVTDVMHDILYEKSDIKIAQLTVREGASVVGQRLHDISWHEEYGVIILAVVDLEMGTSFVFTSKGFNHHIDPGDVLVVIGYEQDIEAFERMIGESSEQDWHHWGR